MNDFTCDLNCPTGFPHCCSNCRTARKYYFKKDNEKYWSDERGFLGDEGCRLPRIEMPKECREYDCRYYTYTVKRFWLTDKWIDIAKKAELGYRF